MSSQSPVSVLFSSDGYELAVDVGIAIPANTRGILFAGSDGADPRFILTDTSGRIITVSNGLTAVAPPADANLAGGSTTTAAPTYVTGHMDALSLTTLGGLRIDGVYASGTATATAADVMTSGAIATSAVPGYTTATLNPLSQTLIGGLRVDGVYVVGTADATAADVMSAGGYCTTAAPTYSSATLNPLSMDLAGNLRVIGTFTPTKSGTGTLTNVASNGSSVTLLASNTNRLSATFFNDSPTEILYIGLTGSAVSLTSYTIKLMPYSYWELPLDYTGQVNGIWNNMAGGAVRITELT